MPAVERTAITWKELAKHNTDDDCWLAVEGKVYDITPWMNKHPGGADVLRLAAGRDATHLFQSYHPFTDAPAKVLAKFYRCELEDVELIKYPYPSNSKFYAELCKRVGAYFRDNNVDPSYSPFLIGRFISIYGSLIALYYLMYLYQPQVSMTVGVFAGLAFGFWQAIFSLQLMHDASHTSITHMPFMWKLTGASWDALTGASFYAWLHQHFLGHHLTTNVKGADPDIGTNDPDFRRITSSQRLLWWYKYQHIYAPLMYGLLTFKFRVQDFDTFYKLTNGAVRVAPPTTWHWVAFWFGKIAHVILRLLVPIYLCGWRYTFWTYMAAELVTGYWLSLNFQVSHVCAELEHFDMANASDKKTLATNDWAALQVRTTLDYGHGSWLQTWWSGALNYQVVHHLFPSVSQTHYPAIAPIVMEVCKEFNVKYVVLPNIISALGAHIGFLREMGRRGKLHHD